MSKQKHYLIYQITNLVNGKIYIGKHETYDIEDKYFGSGKYLANAKVKYGLENFVFKVLIDLKSKEEMNLLEKMVVTEEFCKRKDTYNICEGGNGGWAYANSIKTPEERSLFGIMGANKTNSLGKNGYKLWREEHPSFWKGENNPMFGHVYTDETLQKMSESHLGEKNHMAQKQWIRNPATHESKTILKTDPIPEGWEHGRYCK